MTKRRFKSTPDKPPRPSTTRPGQYICGCKRGYASLKDGMCSSCRGGTLEQQAVSILKAMAVCRWSVEFRDSPTVIFTGTYSQLLYAYSGRPITKVTCLER